MKNKRENNKRKKWIGDSFDVAALLLGWLILLLPVSVEGFDVRTGIGLLARCNIIEISLSFILTIICLFIGTIFSLYAVLQKNNEKQTKYFDISYILITMQTIFYSIFGYKNIDVMEWMLIIAVMVGTVMLFIIHFLSK